MATTPTTVSLPTGDFITSTLIGAMTSASTSATIGSGLNIPASNGLLEIHYDSVLAVGVDNGPETVLYTSYNSGTGALSGITRGVQGTTGVAHVNTATVQAGMSIGYLNNLIDLISNAGWTSWVPSYAAGGSMTYTGVTTNYAKYMRIGKTIWFQVSASGTTGGTPAASLTFTLPAGILLSVGAAALAAGGYVNDNSLSKGAWAYGSSTSVIAVERYDSANFTAGAGEGFSVFGTMETA